MRKTKQKRVSWPKVSPDSWLPQAVKNSARGKTIGNFTDGSLEIADGEPGPRAEQAVGFAGIKTAPRQQLLHFIALIERENALYLTQSKVYDKCCALGPVIVTPDEIGDVRALEMTCTITRNGEERFAGKISISKLHRKLETMVEYLTRANSVPAGTVLLTGTGIIVTRESALAPGDVVTIAVPGIGELSNPAAVVG